MMTDTTGEPIQAAEEGHADCKPEELFHRELGLVEVVAKQVYSSINALVALDELLSAGQQGLFEAARRFDPKQGVAFRTYANYRVRGAILDAVREASGLSRRMQEHLSALSAVSLVCEGSLAHVFVDIDESEAHDSPQALVDDCMSAVVAAAAMATETAIGSSADMLGISSVNPEEACARSELLELIRRLTDELEDREASVIRLMYFEHLELDAIATALKIRKPWVCRLHTRAIERLAKRLQSMK